MTGYTVHTGSSKKFTEGWDKIFTKPAKSSSKQKKSGKSSTAKQKRKAQ